MLKRKVRRQMDEVESALKESSQADFDEAINRMKADNGRLIACKNA